MLGTLIRKITLSNNVRFQVTGGTREPVPIYKAPLYVMCPLQESLLTLCNAQLNVSHPSI